MHNLDRTQAQYETGYETGSSAFETNLFEAEGPFEVSGETQGEHLGEFLGEGEIFGEALGEGEVFGEVQGEGDLTEAQEMELAAELLAVRDEAELEQFLGNLFRRVGGALRGVASRVAPALGGILKNVARRALPILGGAAGTFFGGPLGGRSAATSRRRRAGCSAWSWKASARKTASSRWPGGTSGSPTRRRATRRGSRQGPTPARRCERR